MASLSPKAFTQLVLSHTPLPTATLNVTSRNGGF